MAQATQLRKGKIGAGAPAGGLACASTKRQMRGDLLSRIHGAAPRSAASELDRLRKALHTVAELLVHDPIYAPIFIRLEEEIAIEEAKQQNDVLARARARAIIRQNAMGASSERMNSSEPPSS